MSSVENEISRHCGFVSIVGLPNAGKSTLVNALVGEKVSIVSQKVQTTRARMMGIALHGNAQLVLLDTPGVFSAKKTMERTMMTSVWDAVEESDIVVHLVDAARKNVLADNEEILKALPENKRCFLVLNKIDLIPKDRLLALTGQLNAQKIYEGTYMISALKLSGVADLKNALAAGVPMNEWLFDEDQITDAPMRFMAAEITREKIYDYLHQELPYASLVMTEGWEAFDNGDLKISQVIFVKTDNQKAIVLGRGGQMIKKIGAEARQDITALTGQKTHLKLFVKVQPNWDERPDIFKHIAYT